MADPLILVNPHDRTSSRFVLAFGAYGWTVLVCWANSLEDALDEAIDWIVDNEPGLLADDAVREAYEQAIADGMSEEDAQTESEIDVTCGGNCGNYIHSAEWSIVSENPTRAEMLALVAEHGGVKVA